MAGKNNKASRGSGGTVSSAPPKPSAMKVNLFQQASREARSKNTRAFTRTSRQEDVAARGVNQRMKPRSEQVIPARGMRKTQRSLQTAQAASAYRIGLGRYARTPGPANYRAPATRLY